MSYQTKPNITIPYTTGPDRTIQNHKSQIFRHPTFQDQPSVEQVILSRMLLKILEQLRTYQQNKSFHGMLKLNLLSLLINLVLLFELLCHTALLSFNHRINSLTK